MTLGVRRLALISRGGGAGSASADTAGTTYTATGLKVGSSAILYGNGTQIATATVDGTGKASWTLGSKPAAGTIITYDGVVVGSGGTVPVPVSALGPTTASFAAGSTTPIPITGLNSGETVASVTGSFTVSGNSIVPSAGLVAGSYSPVVTTNTGRTLTIAVTANAGSVLLPLNARAVFLGDSITSLQTTAGLRNFTSWALFFLNGRVRRAVGGDQGIGGTRLALGFANNMQDRAPNVTAQKPDIIVFMGGVNDGPASATLKADWKATFDLLRSGSPNSWIVACTPLFTSAILGSGPSTATWNDFHDFIRTTVAADPKAKVAETAAVFTPNTSGAADSNTDGLHPNLKGGRKVGQVVANVIDTIVAQGSILYASAPAPAEQIDTGWLLTGTDGTKAGTVAPAGSVATGKTLTNNTEAAVAASKETAAFYDRQVVALSGSVTTANATVALTSTASLPIAGSAAGDYYEIITELSLAGAGGGAPVGVRQFGNTFFSGLGFDTSVTDANATVDLDAAVQGVVRSRVLAASTASTAQAETIATLKMAAGAADAVLKVSRPIVRKVDTASYAAPFYLGNDGITPAAAKQQITGTMTNGSVQTGRPGQWSGGALTFAYRWLKNGAPISGATATTYTASGLATGDVLAFEVTANNSVGPAAVSTVTVTWP